MTLTNKHNAMAAFHEGERLLSAAEARAGELEQASDRKLVFLRDGVLTERFTDWYVYSFQRVNRAAPGSIFTEDLPVQVMTSFGRFPARIHRISTDRLDIAVATDLGTRVKRLCIGLEAKTPSQILLRRLQDLRSEQPVHFENTVARFDPDAAQMIDDQYRFALENVWTGEHQRAVASIESWSTVFLHTVAGADTLGPFSESIASEIKRGGRVVLVGVNEDSLDSLLWNVCKKIRLEDEALFKSVRPLRFLSNPGSLDSDFRGYCSLEGLRARETKDVRASLRDIGRSIQELHEFLSRCRAAREAFDRIASERQELKQLLHTFPSLDRDTSRLGREYLQLTHRLNQLESSVRQPSIIERIVLTRAYRESRLHATRLETSVCRDRLQHQQRRHDAVVNAIERLTGSIKAAETLISGRSSARIDTDTLQAAKRIEELRTSKRFQEAELQRSEESIFSRAQLLVTSPMEALLHPERYSEATLVIVQNVESIPFPLLCFIASFATPSSESERGGRLVLSGDPLVATFTPNGKRNRRAPAKAAPSAWSNTHERSQLCDQSLFERGSYRFRPGGLSSGLTPQIDIRTVENLHPTAVDALNGIFYQGMLQSRSERSTEGQSDIESATNLLGEELIHIFDTSAFAAQGIFGSIDRAQCIIDKVLIERLSSILSTVGIRRSQISVSPHPRRAHFEERSPFTLLELTANPASAAPSIIILHLSSDSGHDDAAIRILSALRRSPAMLIIFADLSLFDRRREDRESWLPKLLSQSVIHDTMDLVPEFDRDPERPRRTPDLSRFSLNEGLETLSATIAEASVGVVVSGEMMFQLLHDGCGKALRQLLGRGMRLTIILDSPFQPTNNEDSCYTVENLRALELAGARILWSTQKLHSGVILDGVQFWTVAQGPESTRPVESGVENARSDLLLCLVDKGRVGVVAMDALRKVTPRPTRSSRAFLRLLAEHARPCPRCGGWLAPCSEGDRKARRLWRCFCQCGYEQKGNRAIQHKVKVHVGHRQREYQDPSR